MAFTWWPQPGIFIADLPELIQGDAATIVFAIPPARPHYGADRGVLSFPSATLQLSFANDVRTGTTEFIELNSEDSAEGDNLFAFNFASADTECMDAGTWRYVVKMDAQIDGVNVEDKHILCAGMFLVVDPTTTRLSHNERMVKMLEDLIEARTLGRGDVTFYTIGDRQVQAMKLGELREELARYRYALQHERQGERRAFWYG